MIEPGHLPDQIDRLVSQRFSYENFYRLLARIQGPGDWDTANDWGMKKLAMLDAKRTTEYWIADNFERIGIGEFFLNTSSGTLMLDTSLYNRSDPKPKMSKSKKKNPISPNNKAETDDNMKRVFDGNDKDTKSLRTNGRNGRITVAGKTGIE